MTVERRLADVGRAHHAALLALLADLDAAQWLGRAESLPGSAAALQRAMWPFLQAYGQRDGHGSVRAVVPELGRSG